MQEEYNVIQRQIKDEVFLLSTFKEMPLLGIFYLCSFSQSFNASLPLSFNPSRPRMNSYLCAEDESAAEAQSQEVVEHEARLEELVVRLDLVGNALSELFLPASEGIDLDEEALELDMVTMRLCFEHAAQFGIHTFRVLVDRETGRPFAQNTFLGNY